MSTHWSARRMACSVFLLLLLYCSVLEVSSLNPGFKARVTQKGFNYVNQVAMEALAQNVYKLNIPDTSGSSGKLSYSITGVKITGFTKPTSSLSLAPPTGITWSSSGAGIGLKGTLHYTYHFVFPISDTIEFDASASGISFKLGIALSNDTKGRLHISTSSCAEHVGGISITFHGGAAWLYNLFSEIIDGKVKDALRGQVTKAVNVDAEKRLSQIPVTIVLADKFLLDYRLISNPHFTSAFMDIFLKGEIYWKNDQKEAPFSPSTLPKSAETSRMLYLWVTPYMANTFGYTALQHGYLKYNLTASDLPPGKRSILNTTCTNMECIGVLIPQIGKKYPNSKVKLNMYATKAPEMKINNGMIGMKFAGNVDMHIDTGKGIGPHLVTINCTMYVNVNVSLNEQLLQGQITKYKLDVGVLKSDVGFVDAKVLQFLMDITAKTFIIPLLNAQGKKGLVLPITGDVHLVNTQINIIKDAIMIASDVLYKPRDKSDESSVYNPVRVNHAVSVNHAVISSERLSVVNRDIGRVRKLITTV